MRIGSNALLALLFFLSLNHFKYFFWRIGWSSAMNHGMAVRADRAEVFDWVNVVFGVHVCQLTEMMNMNQTLRDLTVLFTQFHTAYHATTTVVKNALR